MKIEKLSKDNIKEFIKDMRLIDTDNLELNINKNEFYGVKKDDVFLIGFDSVSFVDTIAILYYNPKLSTELFYECIDFLNKSLVVQNYLIIELFDHKYMKLLDDRYKCKEMLVTMFLSDDSNIQKGTMSEKNVMKEKFIDIEMKSIKYNSSKDMVSCNLVKQNIQDKKIIVDLHEHFKNLSISTINFIIYSDSFEHFKELGYDCLSKSYVIKN